MRRRRNKESHRPVHVHIGHRAAQISHKATQSITDSVRHLLKKNLISGIRYHVFFRF